ncbi:MAG: site-2 protease family protein, partial [Gammaproteobacteria bacterium]
MSLLEYFLQMMRHQFSTPQIVAVCVIPVLFAITLHEVSHGWMARLLGDRTAEMLGRLSLNPVRHIDPVGTILVPAILLVIGAPILGWAKPVPITAQNFANPRRGMAWVAAAGPGSNLLMAIFWALVARLAQALGAGSFGTPLFFMGVVGVFANLVLGLLNLIPLLPLDGGRLLSGLLPRRTAATFDRIEPY